ncbi:reverse transcriptase zinc-binding domain-containing protein [Artemisia annua]|uniref:Reverse transcriptase zinc-binding domain-containing protein n=1 Tax=Artemisia annua TaxID=35608 RepID=A0A2U1MR09_ARTAN|nr:reverse transcriptase zinc-binding domain-containing protein [Artemisia annua]
MTKWWWRFHTDQDALGCKVIKELHGNNGNLHSSSVLRSSSSGWNDVVRCGSDIDLMGVPFTNTFSHKILSGERTCFWSDIRTAPGLKFSSAFPLTTSVVYNGS